MPTNTQAALLGHDVRTTPCGLLGHSIDRGLGLRYHGGGPAGTVASPVVTWHHPTSGSHCVTRIVSVAVSPIRRRRRTAWSGSVRYQGESQQTPNTHRPWCT